MTTAAQLAAPREPVKHELKTWPEPFRAVVGGVKRYEIRKQDRDFRVGDELMLREWDPGSRDYTGSFTTVTVTYMTPGGAWGLPSDMCVMSLGFRSES
jgi:hypothetical protein